MTVLPFLRESWCCSSAAAAKDTQLHALASSFAVSKAPPSPSGLHGSAMTKHMEKAIPGATWQVKLSVGPAAHDLEKKLLPNDSQLQELRQLNRQAREDFLALKARMERNRFEREMNGLSAPGAVDSDPQTLNESANRLMQAGDYDDGPPYPLDAEPPPSWRHAGPEVAEVAVSDKEKLGSGVSYELTRCFEGGVEKPCGACHRTKEAQLPPLLLALALQAPSCVRQQLHKKVSCRRHPTAGAETSRLDTFL
mmetsp:Transcript_31256/g.72894  ORF Transcript_31256/g.72894 Transcript_31256/m.72894 type:complete len:252 (+) Transcript_31256:155-910(+)